MGFIMKRMLLFSCLICTIIQAGAAAVNSAVLDSLDQIIRHHAVYAQPKEEEIARQKTKLDSVRDDMERFRVLGEIADAYRSYSIDSQLVYTQERIELSERIGNPDLVVQAMLNMSECYYMVGMYKEADELLADAFAKGIPDFLKSYYYHLRRILYELLADYSSIDFLHNQYLELLDAYRDSILSVNPVESFIYAIVKSDQAVYRGNWQEAIDLLKNHDAKNNLSIHEKALLYYGLAKVYVQMGDTDNAIYYYALSSQCDLKAAVREYISLRELAELLFERGDIERAYNYIKCSMDDAALCNARLRAIELLPIYKIIQEAYQAQIEKQRKSSLLFTYIISVCLFVMMVTFILVFWQNRKLSATRKKLKTANDDLLVANSNLAESNHIKEEYISRYMNQCSNYIEKMDEYRRQLNKMATSGQSQELFKTLKSSKIIDKELKEFYANFDESFLQLYPDFVQKFNDLLEPSARVVPKGELLSPELRIYALIRLGITDSAKIAQFLRYSITTIYNYRTKMRNKALIDRNSFDERVMRL